MADPSDPLTGGIGTLIAAVGALGTAAYGLVDVSKAFGGGISHAGFGHIRRAIEPFVAESDGTTPIFGKRDVIATLRANWLNGVAKADQKAVAKSLVRLALTPTNAERLANETGVDPAKLKSVAEKVSRGEKLGEDEFSALGRFDAVASAVLDEAYERADQAYRNFSKLAGAFVSTALAVAGGAVIHTGSPTAKLSEFLDLWSPEFWKAVLIGLIATPVAPVAKDLSSALATAVKAASVLRR